MEFSKRNQQFSSFFCNFHIISSITLYFIVLKEKKDEEGKEIQ